MNSTPRRLVLGLTAVLGSYVGAWAELLPRAFFDAFPGFGLHWISEGGAYDEHLIRDVGSLYLALTALSVAAIVARGAGPSRLAGLTWTVFGVLHLGYHVAHPEGDALDVVGTIISLGVALALGVLLLLPPRPTTARKEHA